MFVGDYWPMEVTYTYKDANEVDQTVTATVNFRIADFDYYLKTGDTQLTTHHAVIVPDANLYTARMNPTDTTEGGYVGSEMRTKNLERAKALITAAFGSGHVLTYREFLINAVKDGVSGGGAWLNSTVELMTEQMVYGATHFDSGHPDGSVDRPWEAGKFYMYTVSNSQLSLFRLRHDLVCNRAWYWLRNIVSGLCFANVNNNGNANYNNASILAVVCVLIHFRATLSLVLTHGLREGRAVLCTERCINANRYGASYD